MGGVAIVLCFLVIANLTPFSEALPNTLLWTWLGVLAIPYTSELARARLRPSRAAVRVCPPAGLAPLHLRVPASRAINPEIGPPGSETGHDRARLSRRRAPDACARHRPPKVSLARHRRHAACSGAAPWWLLVELPPNEPAPLRLKPHPTRTTQPTQTTVNYRQSTYAAPATLWPNEHFLPAERGQLATPADVVQVCLRHRFGLHAGLWLGRRQQHAHLPCAGWTSQVSPISVLSGCNNFLSDTGAESPYRRTPP